MRRRDLLKLTAGALLPVTLPAFGGTSTGEAAIRAGARQLTNFGLQLSTVGRLMAQDFEGTLRNVAEIGYPLVEFSAMGSLGRPIETVQRILAETGLKAPVGRVSPRLPENFLRMPREEMMRVFAERGQAKYLVENVTRTLDDAHALEQKVINLPALLPAEFESLDQVKRNIETTRVMARRSCPRTFVTRSTCRPPARCTSRAIGMATNTPRTKIVSPGG